MTVVPGDRREAAYCIWGLEGMFILITVVRDDRRESPRENPRLCKAWQLS